MRTISTAILGSVVLMLGACGSSSGGGNLSKIKGTWQPISYSSKVDCGANGAVEDTTGSNITWSMGVSSDLVQTDPSTTCIINANLVASTATAVPGQTCVVQDSSGDTISISLTQYAFSLSADFQTASEAGSGHAQVTFPDNTTASCSYSIQAQYHKIGT